EMHIDVDVSEWAYQPAPHILLQKPKIDESPRILVNAPHIPAQAAGQLAHADSTCAQHLPHHVPPQLRQLPEECRCGFEIQPFPLIP
ncbi:hypothetical protein NSP01_24140, partial [Salmonella enterica]|nr:hypothetical protein [Salmonella enterica]